MTTTCLLHVRHTLKSSAGGPIMRTCLLAAESLAISRKLASLRNQAGPCTSMLRIDVCLSRHAYVDGTPCKNSICMQRRASCEGAFYPTNQFRRLSPRSCRYREPFTSAPALLTNDVAGVCSSNQFFAYSLMFHLKRGMCNVEASDQHQKGKCARHGFRGRASVG